MPAWPAPSCPGRAGSAAFTIRAGYFTSRTTVELDDDPDSALLVDRRQFRALKMMVLDTIWMREPFTVDTEL